MCLNIREKGKNIVMENVLITGGSRGIGRSCVYEFIKKGYRLFFTYNKSEMEQIM